MWQQNWLLYALLIPAALLILLLKIYPLWGISIAFVDFNPVKGVGASEWVGLKNFIDVFNRPDMGNLIRNTLLISIGKIVLGEIAGLAFALLLYEVQFPPYRRLIQTVATFPHFFSWVIIGSMALMILGSNGYVNQTLGTLGIDRIRFLADKNVFPLTLIGSDVWKEFGWSAVIYLAALTQIHSDLLEAAAVDGAGRGARLWHIILPGVLPVFVFMLVLGFGSVLDAGMDQVLVLYNPAVYATGDILDTYVYRMGLVNSKFEIATVVGIVKAFVGLAAILLANWVSVKVTRRSILL
jgi:putative aldouronate transport system permease protein